MDGNSFIDKYQKLLSEEEPFLITREDLNYLVDPKNIMTMDSYRHLVQLNGLDGLLDRLDVNPTIGLCDKEEPKKFHLRAKIFGRNISILPKTKSFTESLKETLNDKIMIFLIFVATLRLLVDLYYSKSRWFDYGSIYIVVILICLITAITNYGRDKVFAKFQLEIDFKEVRVLRSAVEKLIPKGEILVGDILIVNAGDILPVDGIIIKAYSISIEKENKVVNKYHNINFKNDKKQAQGGMNQNEKFMSNKIDEFPIILSGNKILRGYAYLCVLAVGNDAFINKKIIATNITGTTQLKHSLNSTAIGSNSMEVSEGVAIHYNENTKLNINIEEENMPEVINFLKHPHPKSEVKSPTLKTNLSYKYSTEKSKTLNISDENFVEIEREVLIDKTRLDQDNINTSTTPLISKNTLLQNKVYNLAQTSSRISIIAGIITGIFFILTYYFKEHTFQTEIMQVVIDAILYGIVLIVVAVPEGAHMVVALSLAFSINKIREEKTIIKNIQACENMASVDCICTDYTGILTNNDMRVKSIYIEDKLIEGRDISNLYAHVSEDLFNFFCESIAINTIAFAAEKGSEGLEEYFGDPIECCLIRYLKKISINYSIIRNNMLRPIIDSSPNTSDYKISFTIIEMDEKRDFVRLYAKGNYESLIDLISNYIEDGQIIEHIYSNNLDKIKLKCINMLKDGDIPILVCYRDIPRDQYNQTRQAFLNKDREFLTNIVRQLTFICLIGMYHELKQDVKIYIKDCQNAGINVKMVTMQNKESARISAENCGILEKSDTQIINNNLEINSRKSSINNLQILDSKEDIRKFVDIKYIKKSLGSMNSFEFSVTDTNKFNNLIENADVICRAQARDKFILVAALKQKGSIVAVTGDGVSDSLAMKTAHVGISLGYRSSDMSKEASDIILMDDNFKSILTAIVYGRNIYDTVRKFLQFQLTAAIVTVILVLFSAFPLINFYFYPNQLLWINLIIDALGPISLASEQPDREEILKKKPYKINSSIITKTMIVRIAVQSSIQIIVLLVLLFFGPVLFDIKNDLGLNYREWQLTNGIQTTIIFNCLVFMQIFNALISRCLEKDKIDIFKNITKHYIFIFIQSLILILQFLIIKYGGSLTRTRHLHAREHFICLIISSFTLLTLPIVKYLPFSENYEEDVIDENKKINGIK